MRRRRSGDNYGEILHYLRVKEHFTDGSGWLVYISSAQIYLQNKGIDIGMFLPGDRVRIANNQGPCKKCNLKPRTRTTPLRSSAKYQEDMIHCDYCDSTGLTKQSKSSGTTVLPSKEEMVKHLKTGIVGQALFIHRDDKTLSRTNPRWTKIKWLSHLYEEEDIAEQKVDEKARDSSNISNVQIRVDRSQLKTKPRSAIRTSESPEKNFVEKKEKFLKSLRNNPSTKSAKPHITSRVQHALKHAEDFMKGDTLRSGGTGRSINIDELYESIEAMPKRKKQGQVRSFSDVEWDTRNAEIKD